MTPVYVGLWSLIPPLLTIILALMSKDVISSLLLGIISGSAIYSYYIGGGIPEAVETIFFTMSNGMRDNIFIIIFISILGALVHVVTMAGGSKAYGKWAAKKIKSRTLAQLSASALSIFISIDDYFNCLTVGTVMRPITDKHRVSRVKFAYIIDSMAAPVCVLAPISSWAASIVSCIDSTGMNGMTAFIQTIPYNFYALFTIFLVIVLSIFQLDFGPMARFEKNAIEKGDLFTTDSKNNLGDTSNIKISENGKVVDLLIPILTLMIVSVLFMLKTGGYLNGDISLAQAFGNTNSSLSITIGAFSALSVAFIMFVPRSLVSFGDFMSGIMNGMKSMMPAFVILSLAWTMSDLCRVLLCTGEYVGNVVSTSNVMDELIPLIVFIMSGVLSFAMGTSWGTFGILIPVVAIVCEKAAPDITIIALSATLSGSVFGDHCSPISDTMILSSTGAGCNHMDHVSTQMPYSCLVAFISVLGYIIVGFTKNLFLTLCILTIVFVLLLVLIKNKLGTMLVKYNDNTKVIDDNI